MIGSWKWNAGSAVMGAVVIFLFSFDHNPITTVFYRTGISFVIFFSVTYAVRWMLGEALQTPPLAQSGSFPAEGAEDEGKGRQIDLTTPDEVRETSDEFQPITLPRLTLKADEMDPERLAQAVRHMSEK